MNWVRALGCVFCMSVAAWPVLAGDVALEASRAKISGGARYDRNPDLNCIRYWGSTNVSASWKVDAVPRGTWRVFLTYACPDNMAGSEFEVVVGGQKVTGTTAGTGSWTTFKEMDLGPVILRRAGPVDVVLRIARMAKSSAWDVRGLRLVPES